MATLANFRTQFPEFNGASDGLVTAMLNAASLEIDNFVWGAYGSGTLSKADNGQMYLTAHKLATSPWGQNAKMIQIPGERAISLAGGFGASIYGQNYFLLMRQVSAGFRVC